VITARRAIGPSAAATAMPAVFLACGDLLVAVDAGRVVHLLLADEVPAEPPGSAARAWRVATPQGVLPGWDLADLLGVACEPATWLVLVDDRDAPFALRAGRSLCVRPRPTVVALPAGVRGSAGVVGMFVAPGVPELAEYCSGVMLAVDTLVEPAARAQARAAIDAAARAT